ARAGTPVGVLLYRYLKMRYALRVPHYSISIIRGKGIDENALHYILQKHPDTSLVFVDGWTGKGAISKVLNEAVTDFNNKHQTQISANLAVLADPGHCAEISATFEDFLIPSACLNSTISGLVSRTFHRNDIIKSDDFHGARFYEDLVNEDRSLEYIETICQHFESVYEQIDRTTHQRQKELMTDPTWEGMKSVERIAKLYGIENINFIKPGIGETTRVLLRRVPWKILVHTDKFHLLDHVLQLAKEKNVEVEEYRNMSYSCCGLIKQVV
ncbi:MAG: cysteine protease StiP family protein, partial [Bacteroidales bacterium]|nr:cysteine protease StiP family protein [Bacteroidales bacterium]